MTNLPRVTGKIFAESASATGNNPEIGKFGNAKQQIYTGEADISEIQNSEAWSQGWTSAVVSNSNFPPLPEMNGVLKNLSQQICYILQKGIAEWDKNTIYYENNYVNYNGKLYRSKIDNNTTEPGRPEGAANWSTSELDVSIATLYEPGIVQPDGKTITIDEGGVISSTLKVDIATTEKPGIVQPDGKTITIDEGGVISISPDFFSEADDGVTPSVCTGLTKVVKDNQVLLKWTDPEDTILNGKVVASWGGTMIVKKQGSYPINEEDGELVINSTIAQQYKKEALVDTVDNPDNWYYKAFPYSTYNKFTYNDKNCFKNTTIYEFTINENDSNPDTMIDYPEGSANYGFTPAYMDFTTGEWHWGDWEDAFFIPKPCVLLLDTTTKETTFQYYLNPDDYSLKADGTKSDLGDHTKVWQFMIEWGQVWLKYEKNEDDGLIHVYIAESQVDETYHCYTHVNKNSDRLDYIYTHIYAPGYVLNQGCSQSGITQWAGEGISPSGNYTHTTSNGEGWGMMNYGQVQMIQALTMLIIKSTASQLKIGLGPACYTTTTTGLGDKKGMFYWKTSDAKVLKAWGVENMWGNYWEYITGYFTTTSPTTIHYKLSEDMSDGSSVIGFQSTYTGYLTTKNPIIGSTEGYISKMQVNNGLFPLELKGSATTYYCDIMAFQNNGAGSWGWGDNNNAHGGILYVGSNLGWSGASRSDGGSMSFIPQTADWKKKE